MAAFLFSIWRLADDVLRKHFWRRYGYFVLLIFLGSVGGAINAAALIQTRYFFQRINRSEQGVGKSCDEDTTSLPELIPCYAEKTAWMSKNAYWLAVSLVPYGTEFLCLCCATLLVMHSLLQCTHVQRRAQRDLFCRLSSEWSIL